MPVSRRTHDAIVLGVVAEREKLRRERNAAVKRADRADAVVRTMARLIHDLTEGRAGRARMARLQQARKPAGPEVAS